jgi:hypothetical protein
LQRREDGKPFGVVQVIRDLLEREKPMSTIRKIGAALVASLACLAPAAAQQVMSEPAYCAFFYPGANCQNKGPGNPYTDPNYYRNGGASSGQQWSNVSVNATPKRPRRQPIPR